jgi:squalene-associated FAD-dependent desaturase
MSERVAVIGGGLAGLAAAVRLVESGAQVELFEARGRLGGRAGSFHDRDSAAWVDHCQHVGMGCCHRLLALCETIGRPDFFRRDPLLRFVDSTGRVFPFRGQRGWPTPLHLAPAFMGLGFLTWRDRWSIGRALLALTRLPDSPTLDERSIADWLRQRGTSDQALRRFWAVVLVSALSETLEGISLAAARKVFVDGFMSAPDAYELLIPAFPLDELSDSIGVWLETNGASVRRGTAVSRLIGNTRAVTGVVVDHPDGSETMHDFAQVVVAAPWHRLRSLASPTEFAPTLAPLFEQLERFEPAAITSVHVWFDRPIIPWPHVVLVDRLSHWVFGHGVEKAESPSGHHSPDQDEHYYQIVISATHRDSPRSADHWIDAVLADLRAVFPKAREATVRRSRVVTQPRAVFRPSPGLGRYRPASATAVLGLYLAGDWVDTGWPATMEGAIRGGELAAAAARPDGRLGARRPTDLPTSRR